MNHTIYDKIPRAHLPFLEYNIQLASVSVQFGSLPLMTVVSAPSSAQYTVNNMPIVIIYDDVLPNVPVLLLL